MIRFFASVLCVEKTLTVGPILCFLEVQGASWSVDMPSLVVSLECISCSSDENVIEVGQIHLLHAEDVNSYS